MRTEDNRLFYGNFLYHKIPCCVCGGATVTRAENKFITCNDCLPEGDNEAQCIQRKVFNTNAVSRRWRQKQISSDNTEIYGDRKCLRQ